MDPTEGGAYRIKMRAPDGTEFPMFGTVHHVRVPLTSSLSLTSANIPRTLFRTFRPVGTHSNPLPVRWYYEIDLHEEQGSTTAEVRATYPVCEDRDRMIEMDGAMVGTRVSRD